MDGAAAEQIRVGPYSGTAVGQSCGSFCRLTLHGAQGGADDGLARTCNAVHVVVQVLLLHGI